MQIRSHLILLAGVMFFGTATAWGQHKHEPGGTDKVGRVDFPVSCKPASQARFNRAVAMLHSFWYEESEAAFRELAKNDAGCAMAHWGVAMSFYHPLWSQTFVQVLDIGRETLAKARAGLAIKGSPREIAFVEALEALYKVGQLDYPTRAQNYEAAMEKVYQTYPDDDEAAVFYALSLVGTAQALPADKTYSREKKAAEILNRVLHKQPNHPGVAHYLIHAYDFPALANLALDAARSYAKIAPAVPHALHMPSHIFTRLGLWQESISSNLDSEAAAKDYARRTKMVGVWDQQLHAMDYLVYAYLQLAQDNKAKSVLDEVNRILKTHEETPAAAYTLAAVPARYALERRQWSEAAALELRPKGFSWDRLPWARAIVYFARGIGAARQGEVAVARAAITSLEKSKADLAGAKGYDWATQVEVQRLVVAAWLALADGKDEESLALMRSAAELEDRTDKHPVTPGVIIPARELLADLLLELKRPLEALKEFEAALGNAPNRFNGIYGAARAAELAGDKPKAREYYAKLLALCAGECNQRTAFQQAKSFLAQSH